MHFECLHQNNGVDILNQFKRTGSALQNLAFEPLSLNNYVISMIQRVKFPDNSLQEVQDKILDALVPLCTMYENLNMMYDSLENDTISADKGSVVSMFHCIEKAMMLGSD